MYRQDSTQKDHPPTAGPPEDKCKPLLNGLAMLALSVFVWQLISLGGPRTEQVSYSEFMQQARDNQFEEVELGDGYLLGRLKTPRSDGVHSLRSLSVDPAVAAVFEDLPVKISGRQGLGFLAILLSCIAPLIVLAALWLNLLRRINAGPVDGR